METTLPRPSLVDRLNDPAMAEVLYRLLDHAQSLDQMLTIAGDLPNLLAIATDVFDNWATQLKAEGIELEQSLRRGLHAALYLGGQIRNQELDRIGFLLKSDVLDEHSVETVGMAGSALSSCRQGTCEHPVPERVGLFGLYSATKRN